MSSLTAQTEQLGPLLSVSEFTVKPGHEMQFREGVKAWKACYLENNGDWTWRLWQRQQGPGNVFTLASNMVNWAEMDKADEAGKNCQDLVRTLINPHIESGSNHISRFQPESSITAPLSGDIIRVAFYKLNPQNGHKMMETVKEVLAIRKSANIEPLGYWYQWLTSDPESPNYHHVMPYTDYAAMDIQQEGVWDTVEKNAGKEKRDELQAAFRSSLENSWIYIYKLDKDLSRPTK
ncbi:hypothetical protein [Pararhodonellum marinum]|uniref:hypothetical protein n=1 Tax=Pararhodonellum marinum TaxID=2755358 RepID=UPI00188E21DD|nr:hypothetical protein [Pararhodonellum marinum]